MWFGRGGDRGRRRGLALAAVWALSGGAAVAALGAGLAVPAHRILAFAYGIPILVAAGIVGLAAWLAARVPAAGAVVVLAALAGVAFLGYRVWSPTIPWLKAEPYTEAQAAGNYLARFGPYFTDRYRTPWGKAVNLDGADSDEVRRFLCDNALMWLRDYRIDGLRIDAVHALFDQSAVPFLEQLAAEVDELGARLGRHLVLIAESDLNDPRAVRPRSTGGYGLDALWNEDFHHALHAVLTGERAGYYVDFGALGDVATALREGFVYGARYSVYRRRRHGRRAVGLDGDRFVGFLQNHDQVGNRPRGERLSQLVSPGRLKIGAALVLTSPFVPMLFHGEEWGAGTPFQYFTDHEDPELGRAVSDGRRREFTSFGQTFEDVPDPQAPETFQRSKLDWTELGREPHAGILDWYRQLIHLRLSRAELSGGRLDLLPTLCDEKEQWLRVDRGAFTIACNLSAAPRAVPLAPHRPQRVVLASTPDVTVAAETVELLPESVAILGR